MQPALFNLSPRPAYQRGSVTSRRAADRAVAFAGSQRDRIQAWFTAQGTRGGTQKEASEALEIGRPSMCARVRELERDGVIVKAQRARGGCGVYVVCR